MRRAFYLCAYSMFYCDYNLWLFYVYSSPAPVSEGASTIHLPVKECHITEGTNCTMYGWGETKSTAFFHPYTKPFPTLTIITTQGFLQHQTLTVFCIFLCTDTELDETLNAVTMPMVNNDMCSQIKGDAGESRICAGGKRGEGVCDVRISNLFLHHETVTSMYSMWMIILPNAQKM